MKPIKNKKQYKQVLQIYDSVFPQKLKIPHADIKFRWKKGHYTIITDNDIKVFAIFINYKKLIHIDYLGVKSDCQGQGLAKSMLNYIFSYNKPVSLECEPHLIPFYNRFGFKLTGFVNCNLPVLVRSMSLFHCKQLLNHITNMSFNVSHLFFLFIYYSNINLSHILLSLYRYHLIDGFRD